MTFQYNDGGRAAAGYKGKTGDCVTRAIAIVAELDYQTVYDLINEFAKSERKGKRKKGISNARTGVYKPTIKKVMEHLGFKWYPLMQIGSGCVVHLHDDELPNGRLLVNLSRHTTAVIDNVIHDTYDPRRESHMTRPNDGVLKRGEEIHPDGDIIFSIQRRCVYGYYYKE